jgi:hypothetical protein
MHETLNTQILDIGHLGVVNAMPYFHQKKCSCLIFSMKEGKRKVFLANHWLANYAKKLDLFIFNIERK